MINTIIIRFASEGQWCLLKDGKCYTYYVQTISRWLMYVWEKSININGTYKVNIVQK